MKFEFLCVEKSEFGKYSTETSILYALASDNELCKNGRNICEESCSIKLEKGKVVINIFNYKTGTI
jgi:hypothetical protein